MLTLSGERRVQPRALARAAQHAQPLWRLALRLQAVGCAPPRPARRLLRVSLSPSYPHAPSSPAAIVSYSAGQWGGTRAAQALRPVLSELGCIPVSAMVHVPAAQEKLGEDGSPLGGEAAAARWRQYAGRAFGQLEWWAEAARAHRRVADPAVVAASPPLRTAPSQRDAPA